MSQFSRRHLTSAAHDASRLKRLAKEANQLEAGIDRDTAARCRTPEEQIARLNAAGHPAKKERARLAK